MGLITWYSFIRSAVPQAFIRRAADVFIIPSGTASLPFVIPPLRRSVIPALAVGLASPCLPANAVLPGTCLGKAGRAGPPTVTLPHPASPPSAGALPPTIPKPLAEPRLLLQGELRATWPSWGLSSVSTQL